MQPGGSRLVTYDCGSLASPAGRGGVKVWNVRAETEPLSAFFWGAKTTPPGGQGGSDRKPSVHGMTNFHGTHIQQRPKATDPAQGLDPRKLVLQ